MSSSMAWRAMGEVSDKKAQRMCGDAQWLLVGMEIFKTGAT